MERDIDAEARTHKDITQHIDKMRQNAIVMVTAKLKETVHNESQINAQYQQVYDFILDNPPPHSEQKLSEFMTFRKLVGNKKAKIAELKEALILLRNGYDPRRLSRSLLEDTVM
jgi:hypothetical protein